MRHANNKGMTLIEIMMVVVILGIIASLAIPSYIGVQKKGKRTEYQTNVQILRLLEEKERSETGQYVAGTTTANLMAALPEFNPGDPTATSPDDDGYLYYNYTVTVAAGGQTFLIRATGKAGTFDGGVSYCLSEDNDTACP